ncbi:MAG: hypothetical protein ABH862_00760, partial [Candidatus Omnitrophota bacterium]
ISSIKNVLWRLKKLVMPKEKIVQELTPSEAGARRLVEKQARVVDVVDGEDSEDSYKRILAARKGADNIEEEFEVVVGMSKDKLAYFTPGAIKVLEEESGVKILALEGKTPEELFESLKEATKGKKVISQVLDMKDEVTLSELRDLLGELKNKAKVIIELMNPEITALTEEKVKEIDDLDEYGRIARIFARIIKDTTTLDLLSKSVYEMRIDNVRTDIMSGVEISSKAKDAIKSGFNENQHKIISVPVRNIADGRFLANDIRKMGLTKEEASAFMHIRLISENFVIEQEKEHYLKITGLGEYLSSDNVIMIAEDDMTFERALDSVRETFPNTSNGSIAIGDTKDLYGTVPEMLEGENAPIFVWMDGEGIVSQLLIAMIEIIAGDGKINESLGSVEKDGLNIYIYIPNTKAIDFKTEIEAYERYVTEVLVRA